MLRKLGLHHVGPADDLVMDPMAPRLNLITGDNGLGKSFLLEAAWWGLTRTWNNSPAIPTAANAWIEHHFDGATELSTEPSRWDPEGQFWRRTQGRPANPGLVLYARVDGSFSVWDPARNYRLYRRQDGGEGQSPAAYQFSAKDVLWGLKRTINLLGAEHVETLCLGLIDEWRYWQRTGDPEFQQLCSLLAQLGPDGDPLLPGPLVRPTLDDAREIPTIHMPYGQDVPITYAPAGVQQMTKLAYVFTWALSAHLREIDRQNALPTGRRISPASQVIVLIDEPETHLHPRWQRTIIPSLMRAMDQGALHQGARGWAPDVQFLIATHSPHILASIEPDFDAARDALWKLDLIRDPGQTSATVRIERDFSYKRGDTTMWLVSDVFDHTSPYSKPAEAAMNAAAALMSQPDTDRAAADTMRARLRAVLVDTDPFWLSWRAWMRSKGWTP